MQLLCFAAIGATGLAASIAQILVLRELLVLFCGNELTTGLIFACWLLWTAVGSGAAGRLCRRLSRPFLVLPAALTLLSLSLPATLLWIRASRIIWAIPRGELVSLPLMLGISITSTSIFCLTSGFLFALTWAAYLERAGTEDAHPTVVYLGEALGAALGGILFYFVLLRHAPTLTSASIVSVVVLIVAAAVLMHNDSLHARRLSGNASRTSFPRSLSPQALGGEPESRDAHISWISAFAGMTKNRRKRILGQAPRRWSSLKPWLAVFIPVVVATAFSARLDRLSRYWEWGPELVSVRDTAFHNLALVKSENQYSLFGNGLWLFSVPDPQTAEYAVHLALLDHPNPQDVLLIGGGVGGLIGEILKHPGILSIDYVEPDPDIIRMAEEYLPAEMTKTIHDTRVRMLNTDAGSFVRSTPRTYDVVLLNMGDPLNAETNRFYTVEFFRRVARLLNQGGIFSLGVSSSPDIIGAKQARFLRSVYVTLQSVFTSLLAIPGSTVRFIASSGPGDLVADPQELVDRISARKLELEFVREYYLFDYMNPMRLEYLSSILIGSGSTAVNKDFKPTSYFNSLIVWSEQIQPVMANALLKLLDVPGSWLWGGLTALILLMLGIFRFTDAGSGAAIPLCVAVVGGAQMVLEIVLLLGFQILEGFVYTELALIISFFMAGTALGAAIPARLSGRIVRPRLWLSVVQGILSLYLIGILMLLFLLQQLVSSSPQATLSAAAIFSLSALAAGILGGLHFALAVRARSNSEAPSTEIGAGLYGLDLAGAAAGALIAVLFLLPAFGLPTTLSALALLTLACALTLLKKQPP